MNKTKLNELTTWLTQQDISLAYLTNPESIAYFTGFESEPHERILALFVPANGEPFLFTPALDVKEAEHSGFLYDVVGYLDSESPFKKIKHEILEQLTALFDTTAFEFDLTPQIQAMQLVKTAAEIEKLQVAGSWADVAFEIGFQAVREGISEQEIVAEIEYQLKKQGISHMSFDTLVLAGDNAANPFNLCNLWL